MEKRQGLRTKAIAALALTAALVLPGCAGNNGGAGEGNTGSDDTWQGRSIPYSSTGQDFYVGLWRGQPGQVTVTCSGDRDAPTMTLASPEGDEAVIAPGEGGAGATITVTGSDGHEAAGQLSDISTTSGEVEVLNTPGSIDDAGMRINGKFTCQTP